MTALMMRGGLCCSLGNVLIVLKAHRCIFYTTTSNIALTFEFPQAELIRKRADDFFFIKFATGSYPGPGVKCLFLLNVKINRLFTFPEMITVLNHKDTF